MAAKRKPKKKSIFSDASQLFQRIEVLIIAVFFLGFFVWAFSKCSSGGQQQNTIVENEGIESPAAAENPDSPTYDMEEETPSVTNRPNNNRPPNNRASARSYTPLYVTLDGLKIRKAPSLDSTIVSVLNLHDEVMYLEKRTDFKQKINIGNDMMVNEPWFMIRSRKGQEGWVYGGGVHFYKWDRLNNPMQEHPENETAE